MTITLRCLQDDDLDDLFGWQSDPVAAAMAAFTRSDPTDRAAFDAHYRRVRSDPDTDNHLPARLIECSSAGYARRT